LKKVIIYPDNSGNLDGRYYASGSLVLDKVMRRYGISKERAEDTKHRERDGASVVLFATVARYGMWTKSKRARDYHERGNHERNNKETSRSDTQQGSGTEEAATAGGGNGTSRGGNVLELRDNPAKLLPTWDLQTETGEER
jgi:hypothetical protein